MMVQPIPKTPRVQDRKLLDRVRAIGHCEVCGNSYLLATHHIKSRGSGGHDTEDNTVCLCYVCHTKAHSGEISKERLWQIVGRRRAWRTS